MEKNNDNAKTAQKPSKAPAKAKPAKKPVMVMVEALMTPVITPKAKLAKGGRTPVDKATAEMLAEAGKVAIVEVLP